MIFRLEEENKSLKNEVQRQKDLQQQDENTHKNEHQLQLKEIHSQLYQVRPSPKK